MVTCYKQLPAPCLKDFFLLPPHRAGGKCWKANDSRNWPEPMRDESWWRTTPASHHLAGTTLKCVLHCPLEVALGIAPWLPRCNLSQMLGFLPFSAWALHSPVGTSASACIIVLKSNVSLRVFQGNPSLDSHKHDLGQTHTYLLRSW